MQAQKTGLSEKEILQLITPIIQTLEPLLMKLRGE